MRCLLHIGLAKTGTSTLQESFAAGREVLLEHGILYPPFPVANHSLLRVGLVEPHLWGRNLKVRARAEGPDRIRAEAQEAWEGVEATVRRLRPSLTIISGEGLAVLPEHALIVLSNRLRALFDQVKVVAYVREPASSYASWMQQKVLVSAEITPPSDFILPAQRSLEGYKGVFEDVEVRAYDRRRLVGGCIVLDFLAHIPQASAAELKVLNANTSISGPAMCVLQAYYRGSDLNAADVRRSGKLLLRGLRLTDDHRPPATLRPGIAPMLIASHAGQFAWLRDTFGVEFDLISAHVNAEPAGWKSDDLMEVLDVTKEQLDAAFAEAVGRLTQGGNDVDHLLEVWRQKPG